MQTNIYILKLQNNKYYVGKSNDLEKCIQSHKNGTISMWTKKYKPISVKKIIPTMNDRDENKYIIKYMNKYGIDNVRGDLYVTEVLNNTQRSEINKQIWRANDCCTQCGRKEHDVKNCKETQDITGKEIIKKKLIKTWVDCQKDGNCSDNCSNKKEIFNCMDCD